MHIYKKFNKESMVLLVMIAFLSDIKLFSSEQENNLIITDIKVVSENKVELPINPLKESKSVYTEINFLELDFYKRYCNNDVSFYNEQEEIIKHMSFVYDKLRGIRKESLVGVEYANQFQEIETEVCGIKNLLMEKDSFNDEKYYYDDFSDAVFVDGQDDFRAIKNKSIIDAIVPLYEKIQDLNDEIKGYITKQVHDFILLSEKEVLQGEEYQIEEPERNTGLFVLNERRAFSFIDTIIQRIKDCGGSPKNYKDIKNVLSQLKFSKKDRKDEDARDYHIQDNSLVLKEGTSVEGDICFAVAEFDRYFKDDYIAPESKNIFLQEDIHFKMLQSNHQFGSNVKLHALACGYYTVRNMIAFLQTLKEVDTFEELEERWYEVVENETVAQSIDDMKVWLKGLSQNCTGPYEYCNPSFKQHGFIDDQSVTKLWLDYFKDIDFDRKKIGFTTMNFNDYNNFEDKRIVDKTKDVHFVALNFNNSHWVLLAGFMLEDNHYIVLVDSANRDYYLDEIVTNKKFLSRLLFSYCSEN